MKKYYDILQIEQTNDEKKVRLAYSNIIKKYNPYKNPEKFQQVNEAFEAINKFIENGECVENETAPFTQGDGDNTEEVHKPKSPQQNDEARDYATKLRKYIEEYKKDQNKINDINNTLYLIVEKYRNKENIQQITKELLNIIRDIDEEKEYFLEQCILKSAMEISDKEVFRTLYESIEKKITKLQLEKMNSDNRINVHIKNLILEKMEDNNTETISLLMENINNLDNNVIQYSQQILQNEYEELYNIVEIILNNLLEKPSNKSKLGWILGTLIPIGFVMGMHLANR